MTLNERENNVADELDKSEDIVWHYTTIDTTLKILKGRNMRATHYTGLNDRLDVKYGFSLALQIVKNMNLQDTLFKELESLFQDIVNDRYPNLWYLICFSHDGDSISQWQGYTDLQCGGCAIGFNKKELEMLFTDTGDKPEVRSFLPRSIECLYDSQEIQHRLNSVIFQSKDNIDKFQQYKTCEGISVILQPKSGLLAIGTRVEIANIAMGAKHKGFAHEKEYRLIFSSDARHEIQLSESCTKRFITCQFNPTALNAIKYIRLSPHGNIEYNRLKIENVLALHPEYTIEILESDMPYRGRTI